MPQPLHVLIVEDSDDDVALIVRTLRRAGFEPTWQRVQTEPEFLTAISEGFELILSDYRMPEFTGLQALHLLKDRGLQIPFILVSGTIGEETAVEAMRQGATDYLLKDRLGRLGLAVTHALKQSELERERVQNETALRVFRALVDQSSDTFEVVDPSTGRFVDVNERSCADLGYTREEHLQLNVADIDPAVKARGWAATAAQIRAGNGWQGESIHRRKDGSEFPVELSVKCVQLDREYFVTAGRDITRRRQIESSLRESERRLREMLENVELIAIILDPQGVVMFCNDYLLALTGWTREEVLGHDSFDLFMPEERAGMRDFFINAATQGTFPVHREDTIKTKSGSIREIAWNNIMLRSEGGAVTGIASLGEDITERKRAIAALQESEQRFRTALDSLIEGCQIISPEWRYLYINPGAVQHARKPAAEMLGRTMMEVFPGIESTRLFAQLQQCMNERVSLQFENEFTFADGTKAWFHLAAQPVPEGLFILSADITARRVAEANLASQLDELQRWHTATVNREDRIFALKAEVNALLAQSHLPPRYADPSTP